MLKRILFSVARAPISAFLIGMGFQHFSRLLPLDRLFEDERTVIFPHPVPSWPFHCLAVPKQAVRSLARLDLTSPGGQAFLLDIFSSLRKIANQQRFSDYRILVNGGAYQDVPQLHFHLGSGAPKGGQGQKYCWAEPPGWDSQAVCAYPHPQPVRQTHFLLAAGGDIPPLSGLDFANPLHARALVELFILAQETVSARRLRAYSVISDTRLDSPDPCLCFHLVSGSFS